MWFVCLNCIHVQDVFEMQADAIEKGQKVVILDDLLATGGEGSFTVTVLEPFCTVKIRNCKNNVL